MKPSQLIFIREYVRDFNGSRAAKVAGYCNPEVAAYRLIRQVKVKEELAKWFKARKLTPEQWESEVRDLAMADVSKFIGPKGLNWREIKKHGRLVKKVKGARGRSAAEVELHDRIKALEMLGRKMGLFAEQPITVGIQNNFTVEVIADQPHANGTTQIEPPTPGS